MTSRERSKRGRQQLQALPGLDSSVLNHLRDGAFDAGRLTQARLLKGLSKQGLAEQVGVSAASVGQWEAEIGVPRTHHLERLAGALDVPVAYFSLGRPYARMDVGTAHFRSLRRTKVSQRAKAIAYVEQLWELTYALEKRIELPPVNVPGLRAGEQAPGEVPREPRAAAQFLRQAWQLPDGPITHLVNKLELHGVVVSHIEFAGHDETTTIDAFSTSHLPRPLVITTPHRANDIYRHRLTVAHELGHLLMHHDVAPGDIQQEREADEFARELLMPLESDRRPATRPTTDAAARRSQPPMGREHQDPHYPCPRGRSHHRSQRASRIPTV